MLVKLSETLIVDSDEIVKATRMMDSPYGRVYVFLKCQPEPVVIDANCSAVSDVWRALESACRQEPRR